MEAKGTQAERVPPYGSLWMSVMLPGEAEGVPMMTPDELVCGSRAETLGGTVVGHDGVAKVGEKALGVPMHPVARDPGL